MCGLSGVVGSITSREEAVAEDLFYYNYLRGRDSCGVAIVPRHKNKGKPEIVKMLGGPLDLFETKEYQKMMQTTTHLILQHNRKATVGPKTSAMAHPFLFSNIVGAHNGTVSLHDIANLPKGKGAISDSRAILESINDIGAVETMKLIPNYMANAWALTWYDKRNHSFNMLRNEDRTLYYCYDEKRENIFWSSEVEHLVSGIIRNGVRRPQGEKCFMLPEHKMFTWEIPNYGQSFQPPKETKIEYKTWSTGYTKGGDSSSVPFSQTATVKSGMNGQGSPVTSKGTFETLFDIKNEAERKKKEAAAKNVLGKAAMAHEQSMISSLGKDKFYLIYKDDIIRIYLDTNTGKYHRYFWSVTDVDWKYHLVGGLPPELEGVDIAETIKKKQVIVNRPLSDLGSRPTHQPPYDLTAESVRFMGMRSCVTKKRDTKDRKPWIIYTWGTGSNQWTKVDSASPPAILPNDLLDVAANHAFVWRGNKKKGTRRVYFRGWGGKDLDRVAFNHLTSQGCTSCGRTPTWTEGRFGGVAVKFWEPEGFLCQFCGEDRELYNYMTGKSKSPIVSSGIEDTKPSIN